MANGVLDHLARQLRPAEFEADGVRWAGIGEELCPSTPPGGERPLDPAFPPAEFALIARHFRAARRAGRARRSATTPPCWRLPRGPRVGDRRRRHGRGRALPARRPAGPGGPQAAAHQPVRPRRHGRGAARLPDDRLGAARHAGCLVRRLCRRAGRRPGGFRRLPARRRHHLDAGADQPVADHPRPCRAGHSAAPRRRAGGRRPLGQRHHRRRRARPAGGARRTRRPRRHRSPAATGCRGRAWRSARPSPAIAHAGMDVSDGLVQDTGHLCRAGRRSAPSSRRPRCRCRRPRARPAGWRSA